MKPSTVLFILIGVAILVGAFVFFRRRAGVPLSQNDRPVGPQHPVGQQIPVGLQNQPVQPQPSPAQMVNAGIDLAATAGCTAVASGTLGPGALPACSYLAPAAVSLGKKGLSGAGGALKKAGGEIKDFFGSIF